MRKTLVAGAAMALAVAAYAQTAEDAFSVWENPENKSHTEFYKCGDNVCAKIIKVVDGQTTDDKNPDPAKRSRPIVGLVIMQAPRRPGPTPGPARSTTAPTARAIPAPSLSRARPRWTCRAAWPRSSARQRLSRG